MKIGRDSIGTDKPAFPITTAYPIAVSYISYYFHAFLSLGDACGQQFVVALHLDQAKPACADAVKAVEVAVGGNIDVVFARHFQNGLMLRGANFLAIDG